MTAQLSPRKLNPVTTIVVENNFCLSVYLTSCHAKNLKHYSIKNLNQNGFHHSWNCCFSDHGGILVAYRLQKMIDSHSFKKSHFP